jgi:HEAT repeat protein
LDKTLEEWIADLYGDGWEYRFLACKTLGMEKIKEAVPRIIELLNDQNHNVRLGAARALGEIGDRQAIDPLVTALAEPNEWVRLQIVEALGKLGDGKVAVVLSRFLETEQDDRVRATIVQVLGKLGDEKMIPILVTYLKDSDLRVRANAVEALESLGDEKITEFLLPMMAGANHRIKANIAKALFNLGDYTGLNILNKMLKEKNEWMRAAAAWALGEVKTTEVIKPLVEALGDKYWFVDRNIIRSLVKTGKPTVRPLLNKLKKKTLDHRVRLGIIVALGEIGDDNALGPLIVNMHNYNGEIRIKAEEAIDRIRENSRKMREMEKRY